MSSIQKVLIRAAGLSGPVVFIALLFWSGNTQDSKAMAMLGVVYWVAVWWLFEITHLAVTAFLPFLLIPLCGISDAKTIAQQYMDPVIFLFMGGFLLSFAIEKWQLHKRVAYSVLSIVGSKPASLLGGVMVTAYLLSFWISNTATVMMLYAAVIALIQHVGPLINSRKHEQTFASVLMIGLSYAASIGGLSTPVGTPTNMILFSFCQQEFGENNQISFIKWTLLGTLVSFLLLSVAFFLLKHRLLPVIISTHENSGSYFKNLRSNLGPLNRNEKIILGVFSLTILLWFTRQDIAIGKFHFYGWAGISQYTSRIHESAIAVGMALSLFFIPAGKNHPDKFILDWDDCRNFPFYILLVFGSGFAIAKGFEVSGLSVKMAQSFHFISGLHLLFFTLLICAVITLVSEFASNVATIQLALPVLFAVALALKLNPLYIIIPATMSASLGFMMPVATAPNTIVYGSGLVKTRDMYRTGLVLNLAGVVIIALISWLLLPYLYA